MSAVILTIMTFMRRDGHIIFTSDCYRQTRDFAANLLAEFGIQVSMVDPTAEAIEKAIRPNTNIIFTESPTNPYLRCLDLPAVVKVAKQHKVMTIIDATLATPYNIKPLEMGVDVVIHSATKYLGGHNDLLAGVALGSDKLMNDVYRMQRMIGAIARPAHLLPAGARPQDLRPADEAPQRGGPGRRADARGAPKIEKVWYPGLDSHPDQADREGADEGLRQRGHLPAQGRRREDPEVHRLRSSSS